jgi:threonine/homoserine/homoserine lactone efflux protein
MLITYLLSAAAIGFSAGVTPGPLQAVFLSYAVKGGWKKALPAAFAPLVTDGPVILLVLVILNNLPEVFLRISANWRGGFHPVLGLGILPGLPQFSGHQSR